MNRGTRRSVDYYKSEKFQKDLPSNFKVEVTGEGDNMEIDIYNSDETTMQGEARRSISVTNQSLDQLKEELKVMIVDRADYYETFKD